MLNNDDDIRDCIHDLSYVSKNPEWQLEHRLEALEKLKAMGSEATSAIPALIRMYYSRIQAEREQAVATLDTIDPAWAAHPAALEEMDYLIKKLGKDHRDANKAVRILSGMGEPVVKPLLQKLSAAADDDFFLAKGLIVLHAIQPPVQALLPLINRLLPDTKNDYLLETMTTILGERNDTDEGIVEGLVRILDNKNPSIRSRAIKAIGNRDKVGEIAAFPLINCLSDKDRSVREEAIHAFSKHDFKTADDFFARMIENRGKLTDEDMKAIFEKVKFWISDSAAEDFQLDHRRFRDNLSWYNRDLKEALAKPEILLESTLAVLYNRGEIAADFIEPISEIYQKYNNITIQVRCMKLLGLMRDQKEKVFPLLLKSLENPHENVREAGVAALSRLDENWLKTPETTKMISSLIENLDSQSTREQSMNTLLAMGESGIPSLMEHLENTEKRLIRQTLIDILGKFGDTTEINMSDLLQIKEKCQNAQTMAALNDLIKKLDK